MLVVLLLACSRVSPPEPPRAPGWLALRTAEAGTLPDTPAHPVAPLLVPMPDGLEDARPGDRYTVWSEYGQLPATIVDHGTWPCGAGGPAVSVMARGKLPAEGPLWLTPGPPAPGVHPLLPFQGHLGNLEVRSDDRLVIGFDDTVFHDAPLDHPHEARLGWLRSDRSALLLLTRVTDDAVVYQPVDVDRAHLTLWREVVVPRCR